MEKIDEKNMSNVVVNKDYFGTNQYIYGSQLYQTNFGVYADIQTTTNGNFSNISLVIINYKGSIDIGFHDTFEPICELVEQNNNQGEKLYIVKLTLEFRAAVSGQTSYSQDVNITKSMDAFKDIPKTSKVFLLVTRSVVPMWGSRTNSPMSNGIFDSEFFLRDGTVSEPRVIIEVPDDSAADSKNHIYNEIEFNENPGFICKSGTSRILRSI